MKKIYSLFVLCCVGISPYNTQAQVTGTKTIGTDYATLAAAITDLNTAGISGDVTINVPAGYTETAPVGGFVLGSATLNGSMSASATLTIRKNGAGASPVLSAFTGTSTSADGIFIIQGTDYVTIDGINLAEVAANTTATQQMEWGYALVKRQATAPFDGCQYVTIKNCAITLNRTNTSSVGIYAGNHIATSTSSLTITAAGDAMSNCTFSADTISNCNTGISIRGYSAASSPYTLYDQNNTVGGSSTTGNVIQNYAGSSTGSGVNLQYQNGATVSYNRINNIAGSGIAAGSTLYGVYVQNGTNVNVDVDNNIFSLTQGSNSSTLYGVYIGCSGTGTVNANSNTITALGGSSGSMYLIYLGSANNNVNTNNNNFSNINVAANSDIALIYHGSSASTANIVCSGNYTSGTSTPYINRSGTSGTFYGYYNNASASGGYTLISNNNFSYITQAGSASFYGVYDQNGGSGQNRYVRNNIISNIASGSGTLYGVLQGYSASQSVSNCQIFNFSTGSGSIYGVNISFSTTTDTVSNCRFSNFTSATGNVYGIYATSSGTTLRFYGDTINTLTTGGTSSTVYGIYQSVGTNVEVYKNVIYDLSATGSGSGSSVNGIYMSSGTANVWNNLVGDLRMPAYTTTTANSGTQLVGIYCGSGTAYTLSHNTVYLNGTSSGTNFGSSAVYAATAATTFRNNIFINTCAPRGTGMVTAYRRSATGLTGFQAASNNNLYYAGVPAANRTIMYDGTTGYQTLANYKTLVTPRESASVTENVTFQSTTGGGANFLKPSTTVATQIESNGIVIAGLTDDIYGTIRAGNTGYAGTGVAPDLGAVEADYMSLDLSAPVIVYTPLTYTCATGDRTITATITDLSGVPTLGALMPRIYYKKGSGTWFSNAGVLTSGTANVGTWTFTILASDMGGLATGDVISYYVIAQDVASTPNVGSVPMGAVASDVATVSTPPATPNTYSINSTLSGTYTVGVGGAYTTITQALNAYNSSCLTGPVTFNLIDASYPSESYPLTINSNLYASSTNTLTIKPASGVAVNLSGSTSAVAIFKLLNAKYVTIDGLNTGGSSLTLTNANTTTSGNTCNIWLASGATGGPGNNTIALNNMTIIGGVNSSTTNQGIVAGIDGASPTNTGGMDNDNITISGNTFKRMGYAIRAIGTAPTSSGGLDNWIISNNIIGPSSYSTTDNIGYNGMFLQSMMNPTVSGNTVRFVGLTTSSSQTVGIYFNSDINGATVTQNNINNVVSAVSGSGTGSVCGLYVGSSMINSTISRNNIDTIVTLNTGGYGVRGMIVNTGVAASNLTIANNFISAIYGYLDAGSLYWAVGIHLDGTSGGIKIYYNSINLFGSFAGYNNSTGSACLYVNSTGNNIDVRNNIFVNTYHNSTVINDKGWAIYTTQANTVFSNINYNDYYVSGTNVLGNIGGTDRVTLADIVTGFGDNANSLNAQPVFISGIDLHLAVNAANGVLLPAAVLADVTVDIDGTVRSGTVPVIGAHEVNLSSLPPFIAYTPLSNVCSSVDRTVTATIRDMLTGVPTSGGLMPRIYYRKNGGSWISKPGTLSSGTTNLGTWTFPIVAADLGTVTSADTVFYYLIAQSNSGNVGSLPSAGLVATDVNTVTSAPTAPNFYQALNLSGTYAVGTGGDYPTISAAVNAYNNGCLTGPVTFLLTDATYPSETFPIQINSNITSSAANTLTIRPATGVSPVITGNSTAIFKFNGADYVTLDGSNSGGTTRNLTITNTNTGTSGTAVIWVLSPTASDGATNNTIKNCLLSGNSSTTTEMCIFSGGTGTGSFYAGYNALTNNSNNTYQNNQFRKSQFGMWLKGVSTSSLDQNTQVISNDFGTATTGDGFNAGGLIAQFQNNATISGNNIQNVIGNGGVSNAAGLSTVFTGLYIRQCTNSLVSANKVFNLNLTGTVAYRTHAIYSESPAFNTSTNPSNNTFANNAVYNARVSSTGPSTWTISGISLNGGYGDKFYYNTVNLTGVVNASSGPAAAFSNGNGETTTQTSSVTVRDNIFVINGSSSGTTATFYAAYWYNSTALGASVLNNNDLSSTITAGGTAYTGYNGSSRSTLSDWQTASAQEANSINTLPLFVSATDPHLQAATSNSPLIGGAPIAGVTTDMDGTTRNTTLTVIGAHELTLPLAPPMIVYAPLTYTCVSADRIVTATISNTSSGVPTSGSLVPRLYYKKNSGAWFSAPGTLTSGNSTLGTWSFTIAVADLGGLVNNDVVSYYFVAQTNTGIVGSMPAAGLVATDVNTVTTPPTTPGTYSMRLLGGTYTVGVGGDYPTITAAANAYSNSCLAGAVTFVLTDATYPSETYPLTFGNAAASATNTLTIKPAAGVAVTVNGSASAVAIFKLLNAKYVTIDGLNTGGSSLTLNNNNVTTSGNTCNIWLAAGTVAGSGNNNIALMNMTMVGGVNSSTNNQGIVAGVDGLSPASTAGMDNDNITISGNTFKRMGYAIRAIGTSATSAGGLDNWNISNNIIGPSAYSTTDNIGYNGMFLQSMVNPVISDNTVQFVGLTTSSSQTVGINFSSNINGASVTHNHITNVVSANSGSNTSSVCAMYLGSAVINSTFARNMIDTVVSTTTSGYSARGIIINTATAASGLTFANNFVSRVYGYLDASTQYWAVGIDIEGSSGGIKIYNNTVSLSGSFAGYSSATGSACLFVNTSGTNIDVRDNIFTNTYHNTTVTSDKGYAIYSAVANTVFSNINYNNYYAAGTNVLGNIGGTDRNTLADIVTGFGDNANSINRQPIFVSGTDLHLQLSALNVPLIAGAPIAGITTDIDGTTRSSTTPVIGAHEVIIPNCSGTPVAGTVTASTPVSCGTFSSTLTLSGQTSLPGISYQWASSPDGTSYTDIAGADSSVYTATVTSTTYYRATVTCTISALSASTTGTQITSNIVPAIVGAPNACVGTTTTLSATPTGGTWISNNGTIAAIGSSTGIVTASTYGIAMITYTAPVTGCTNIITFSSKVVPLPLAVSPAAAALCSGDPAKLLTALRDSVELAPAFGTRQNMNTSTTYPAPFSVYWGGQRMQFLVLASELTALGYDPSFAITSLDFPVVSLGSTYVKNNSLQVRIAPSSLTSLSSFVTTGLVTVRSAADYTAVVGNNAIPFTTPYIWDGTSNLVVDVTFSNNVGGTSNDAVIHYNTNTSYTSTLSYRADNVTPATAASATTVSSSYNARPDFVLRARKAVPVTWAAPAGLYTDAGATIAYTGSAAKTVYASPATGVTTYTATSTYNGCTSKATAVVTVNPLPANIAGANTVCVASTTTLTNDTTGGTWSSSANGTATVGATTGVVTGVAAGIVTMTYTKSASGCFKTMQMTVNPLPAAITGTAGVCEAATITLASTPGSGTWSSDGTSIAVVDPATGVVTGVAAGFAQITYTLPTSCRVMRQVTVNPVPTVSVSPAPVPDVCFGGTTSLTANYSMNEFALMSQDFNAGLGAWTITNIDGSPDSYWQISPSPEATSGATGDGTPMLAATPFNDASITNTLITSPSFSTVGYDAVTLSFNEFLMSLGTSDATVAVEYSTDGTTWNSLLDQVDEMVGSGAWSAAAPEVSIALPAAALGQPSVRLRWNYNSLAGLWWNIDNIKVTAAQPAPSYVWSGAAGLSCTTCTSVDATPASTGANVYSVQATTSAGCVNSTTATVNVNPLPSAIGGTLVVCEGLTTTATNTGGGTWAIATTSVATVNATTGEITGVSGGTAELTYTLPTGCTTTAIVTVNPTPAAIGGTLAVCLGQTTTLTDTDGGGTWSSSAISIADIDADGVVSGMAAGTATITYELPTTCITTSVVTVNPLPATIGGTRIVCQGVSTTLTNTDGGGTWTSGATGTATVGSASGIVTGVSAGIAPITYTLSTGCMTSADVTVNSSPANITGTPEVCAGSVTTLSNSDPGGSWASSAPGVASISTTGIVSGIAMGTATITYSLSAGCIATTVVTVDPLPAPIAGPSQLCVDAAGTFTNGTSGGTWASSTPAVATIDNTTGEATARASGVTLITYTSAAGCVRTRTLTVNALPAVITGPSELCRATTIALASATPGGTWSSGAGTVATISTTGVVSGVSDGVAPIVYTLPTGCTAATSVTVNPLPSAIGGATSVCMGQTTTLTNTVTGGTWNSGTPANALVDAATGIVTGIGTGTSLITYTLGTGCSKTIAVTVNTMPAAITGATNVCQGSTATMATATTGGVWTSSVTTVASINLSTGVVTGLAAGTATISYTMPAGGCVVTSTITVDAMPAAFTGTTGVCSGQTTTLASTPTGGTWSSSNLAVATIDASGVVSGVAAGTTVITYFLSSGCMRSAVVTVNALPVAYNVTGGGNYCSGGPGVHVGLDNSDGGVNYQLYSGTGMIGSPVTGVTGMPVDFGFIAPVGSYSVVGTSMTTGCSANMTGTATVSLTTSTPASVTFASGTGSDSVCSGLPVTFTATATNGGSTPVYQWKVNGIAVSGATTNVFTHTPATGDVVMVNMSSSITCATPSIATASKALIVSTSVMPVASIAVTPGASICAGSSATFSASALYGGSSPAYTWVKNDSVVGVGPSFTYTPANGDKVVVQLASNRACVLADTVQSSVVTMTVSPVYTPVINIAVTPGTMVQAGTSVTMTATVTNGGPSPEYQWYIGSAAITGATSATFTYNMFADGDSVSCSVKGTGACGLGAFNSVTMHVGATGVIAAGTIADIRLMPNPNKGEFAVKGTLSVKADKEVAIEVTNMLGQVVYRTNAIARNGVVDTQIRLDNTLANGMYMLNLISGDDRKVFHFVLEQ